MFNIEMFPSLDVQTPGLLEAMLKWHSHATILAAKDKAAFVSEEQYAGAQLGRFKGAAGLQS